MDLVSELDVQAGAFIDALMRHGYTELADDFSTWWYENRPDDEEYPFDA